MAEDLIFETMEDRGGGAVSAAVETLTTAALKGFTTNWDQGGAVEQWDVATGHDQASLLALRDSLERLVLPSLEAAIAGNPGPFNTDIDGVLDPSLAIIAQRDVT